MNTEKTGDEQAECLHSATETAPNFPQPSNEAIERAAVGYGDPGVPDRHHIQMVNWSFRETFDPCDLIDGVAALQPELTALTAKIEQVDPFNDEVCGLADEGRDIARDLYAAVEDSLSRQKAEATSLWRGPAICDIDAALLDRFVRVLPKWFSSGVFAPNGDFTCTQNGETVQVSASGAWMILIHDGAVRRWGTGLTRLWSVARNEPLSVTAERLARGLGITPRRVDGAAP